MNSALGKWTALFKKFADMVVHRRFGNIIGSICWQNSGLSFSLIWAQTLLFVPARSCRFNRQKVNPGQLKP
jgi:hypothetical protein